MKIEYMKDRTSVTDAAGAGAASGFTGQAWDAAAYAKTGRFVADLGGPVVELLAPQAGEAILDLGCGDGALTEKIAAVGAVVTGIDASHAMVLAARARGLTVVEGSGEALEFDAEFDAVFSNAALHWMPRAEAVIAGVRRALRPGGRFVAEMGGHGNIAAIRTALQAVLLPRGIDAEAVAASFYPSPAHYRRLLEAGGFRVRSIELIPRPTPLPAGMEGWLNTFRNGVLDLLPAEERAKAVAETVALLRPMLCDGDGNWTADYVRLRFDAVRG
jgi:trans-aconitate methyltransferase